MEYEIGTQFKENDTDKYFGEILSKEIISGKMVYTFELRKWDGKVITSEWKIPHNDVLMIFTEI